MVKGPVEHLEERLFHSSGGQEGLKREIKESWSWLIVYSFPLARQ